MRIKSLPTAYCKHWSIKNRHTPEHLVADSVGQCRLASPKIMQFGSEAEGLQPKTVWPLTAGSDWCGEFTERRDDWQSIGEAANSALAALKKKMDEKK